MLPVIYVAVFRLRGRNLSRMVGVYKLIFKSFLLLEFHQFVEGGDNSFELSSSSHSAMAMIFPSSSSGCSRNTLSDTCVRQLPISCPGPLPNIYSPDSMSSSTSSESLNVSFSFSGSSSHLKAYSLIVPKSSTPTVSRCPIRITVLPESPFVPFT